MEPRRLRLWFSMPGETRIRTGDTKNQDLQLCGFVHPPRQKNKIIDFKLKKTDRCSLQFETPYSEKNNITISSHDAICEEENCNKFFEWNPSSRKGKIKAPDGGSLPIGNYVINTIRKIVSEKYDEVSDARVILYEGREITVAVSQYFGECMRKNPNYLFCKYCRLPEKIQPNEDFTELTVRMNEPDRQFVYNIGCREIVGWRNITWFTKVNYYEAEKQQNASQRKERDPDDELVKMSEEESTMPSDIPPPTWDEAKNMDLLPTNQKNATSESFRKYEIEGKEPHTIVATAIPYWWPLSGILFGIFLIVAAI